MLNICTVNAQNKYKIKNYNGIDLKNNDNILKLYNMLEKYDIDIAGTQELTSRCINRLKEFCLPKYNIVGKYRLGNNIITNINSINKFNETNSIITKEQIISCRTKYLYLSGRILSRVVTIARIKTSSDGEVFFLNTHIDYLNINVKKKELSMILKIVKSMLKYNLPIILTGDFNLDIKDSVFNEFVIELQKIGITRIPISNKTHKHAIDEAIDHIFISNDFEIISYDIVKEDRFSDHYPVVAKIKKNNKN